MSLSVPPRFVDLYTASTRFNTDINITGVVTDYMSPSRSRGTDFMFTFSIADHTMGGIGPGGGEGLKVRFFKPMETELPQVRGTGDVIMIRSIKVKVWNGVTLAMSSYATTWVVFPAYFLPEVVPSSSIQLRHISGNRAAKPSAHEMRYAVEICNWHDRSLYTSLAPHSQSDQMNPPPISVSSSVVSTRKDKFSLIQDLQVDTYRDLVGQVIKLYPSNGCVELYFTDYTTNQLLFNYMWGDDEENQNGTGREGDEFSYIPRNRDGKKWPGPFGKQTLTVTLWNPHSEFALAEVQPDDFVHLRNVHIKWSKDAKIEGYLHSDRLNPDRIDITVIKKLEDHDRGKDALRRKREYWLKAKQQAPRFTEEVRGQKRKAAEESANPNIGQKRLATEKPSKALEDPTEMPVQAQKLSKNQSRKKRRQLREQSEKEKETIPSSASGKENQSASSLEKKGVNEDIIVKPSRHQLNPNVHCSHHLHPPRSLSAITSLEKHSNQTPAGTTYDLPFQNINSRATVRIVDFYPRNLADFAVRSPRKSEYAILSDAEDEDSDLDGSAHTTPNSSRASERGWEWRFQLTLEDILGPKTAEKTTMTVYVAGPDAEYLLKLDAEDLCKSPEALTVLRERLFLLWGDLEERKRREESVLKDGSGNSAGGQGRGIDDMEMGLPFQCCLKEYGVKVTVQRSVGVEGESGSDEDEEGRNDKREKWKWERRWRMHGCTII